MREWELVYGDALTPPGSHPILPPPPDAVIQHYEYVFVLKTNLIYYLKHSLHRPSVLVDEDGMVIFAIGDDHDMVANQEKYDTFLVYPLQKCSFRDLSLKQNLRKRKISKYKGSY